MRDNENTPSAGPWQRKYPVELDLYEIQNLRALLGAVGGLAGHSPLEAAHTGDWTLQIAWKLDAIEMEVPEHFGPNATAEQMVERANAEIQRLSAELALKDQALDEVKQLHKPERILTVGGSDEMCAECRRRPQTAYDIAYPCETLRVLTRLDTQGETK